MTPTYIVKLGLKIGKTYVGAQKIDDSTLKTFEMVLFNFQVENKLEKTQFFQKTFLLTNLSMEVVLKMLHLTFNNADVSFSDGELTGRFYTLAEALPTTKRVEMIDTKKFAKAALDENVKTFVVHVTFLLTMAIHPTRKA